MVCENDFVEMNKIKIDKNFFILEKLYAGKLKMNF
jgi:hypothetical protein